MARIHIYDTTLRDGSQGEGVNFSLQDKLLLTRRLDELGVDFIEGGYPLSNPKDFEYFQQVRRLPLRHARIAAFGMTRRKGVSPAEDTCLRALPEAETPIVTIVGIATRLVNPSVVARPRRPTGLPVAIRFRVTRRAIGLYM